MYNRCKRGVVMSCFKQIFFIFYALLSFINAQESVDCDIHVHVSKDTEQKVVFTFTHDANCSITMDQNLSQVTIAYRGSDENISAEDANLTLLDMNITEDLLSLAQSKLGASYKLAGAGPDHFDCSGFVYYLFKEHGIDIPRTSLAQSKSGEKLSREEIQRGDILFFDTYKRNHVNHSGVYLGDGKFIHASSGKAYGVTISDLNKGFYKKKFRWGIRKIDEK